MLNQASETELEEELYGGVYLGFTWIYVMEKKSQQ